MNLLKYSHLITAGCSNSSTYAGSPWTEYLVENFNINSNNHTSLFSLGSGIGTYVDRVITTVKQYTNSLVVVQITDINRLTLGLSVLDDLYDHNNDQLSFNGIGTYTWSHTGNKNWENFQNLLYGRITAKQLKEIGISRDACDFISNQLVLSNFTTRLSLIYLLALKYACEQCNSTLMVFPWFQDWSVLWKDSTYPNTGFNFIEESADSFLQKHGYSYVEEGIERGGHYGSQAHEFLCNKYIIPNLMNTIK